MAVVIVPPYCGSEEAGEVALVGVTGAVVFMGEVAVVGAVGVVGEAGVVGVVGAQDASIRVVITRQVSVNQANFPFICSSLNDSCAWPAQNYLRLTIEYSSVKLPLD